MLTAEDATQRLIRAVRDLVPSEILNELQGNGLIVNLEAALRRFERGT